jgi:hypothetical protein
MGCSSDKTKIGGATFAAALVDVDGELQSVTFLEVFQTRLADSADMDEYAFAAAIRLDKAVGFAIASKPRDEAAIGFCRIDRHGV